MQWEKCLQSTGFLRTFNVNDSFYYTAELEKPSSSNPFSVVSEGSFIDRGFIDAIGAFYPVLASTLNELPNRVKIPNSVLMIDFVVTPRTIFPLFALGSYHPRRNTTGFPHLS